MADRSADDSRQPLANRRQTAIDLIREFVQELPFETAAEAWQRAVQVTSQTPLEWNASRAWAANAARCYRGRGR